MSTMTGNHPNNTTSQDLSIVADEYYVILYAVLCVLISLATVVGNILLFFTVLKTSQLRTPTNSLLLSLATADLVAGSIMMPLYVHQFLCRLTDCGDHPNLCLARKFLFLLTSGASITSLGAVSVDRMIAVSYPFVYARKMNAKIVACIIVTIWCMCLILTSAATFGIPIENWEKFLKGCRPGVPRTAFLIVTPTSFYIPGIAILLSYLKIFSIARSHRRKITVHQEPSFQPPMGGLQVSNVREESISHGRERASTLTTTTSKKSSVRTRRITKFRSNLAGDLKAAKTVSILVGLFLACWSPVAIFYIYINLKKIDVTTSQTFTYVHDAFMLLSFLNTAIDPILYTFLNRDMKSCMKRHLKAFFHRH